MGHLARFMPIGPPYTHFFWRNYYYTIFLGGIITMLGYIFSFLLELYNKAKVFTKKSQNINYKFYIYWITFDFLYENARVMMSRRRNERSNTQKKGGMRMMLCMFYVLTLHTRDVPYFPHAFELFCPYVKYNISPLGRVELQYYIRKLKLYSNYCFYEIWGRI